MTNASDGPHDEIVALSERAAVFAAVAEAITTVSEGEGRSLFILGEPGTGKSSLLEWARALVAKGVEVVEARGSLTEADLPFAYIEQLFGPLSTGAAHAADTDDPLARRAAVHSSARTHMRERAMRRPLVALLDDLQWADPDSLRTVAYLARRIRGMPVVLVGAARAWPDQAARAIDGLGSEGLAQIVSLEPLSRAGSAAVLAAVVGKELPADLVENAFQLTGGIPLLLREAGRTIREEGGLPGHGLGRPDRRHSLLLLSQLGALPHGTIRALQATAVLGTRVPVRLAQTVSATDEDSFAEAIDVAVAAGVLGDEGDGWVAFRHEMLAAALVQDMPPAQRRVLHSRAYNALVETGQFSAAVPHAVRAGLHGDPKVIEHVTATASAALADGALETGMAHLEAAFELAGSSPSKELMERRADALFLANRPEEARDLYRSLIRRQSADEVTTAVMAKATQCVAYSGQLAEALASYNRLIDGCASSDPMLADLLVERAHVIWELDGPAAGLESFRDFDTSQLDPASREKLEFIRSAYLFQTGDLGGVATAERRARALLGELAMGGRADLRTSANVILMHATNCGALERFDETIEMVDRGIEFFGHSGAFLPMVPLLISKLGVLLHSGALIETVTGVDDLEEEFELGPLLAPYLIAFKVRALVSLGRLDEARQARNETLRFPGSQSWFVQLGLELARGQGLLVRGRIADAARVYDAVEETVERVELGHPCVLIWAGAAIDTALASGDTEAARRRTEWLEAHSTPQMGVWPRMIALAGRAGLADARDDRNEADRLFTEALLEPCPLQLERARTLVRYGTWLRHHGFAVRARPLLAEALRIAEERGAVPLAGEARLELSAAGGRRRRVRGENKLTTQQARVATLAATGATNREIAIQLHISARTVESHLAAALLKLNVRTRAELRQRRRELGSLQLEGG